MGFVLSFTRIPFLRTGISGKSVGGWASMCARAVSGTASSVFQKSLLCLPSGQSPDEVLALTGPKAACETGTSAVGRCRFVGKTQNFSFTGAKNNPQLRPSGYSLPLTFRRIVIITQ